MIKAITDRVLVRLEPPKEESKIIFDTPLASRVTGVVESVGEKVSSVKIGDKILFHVFDELPTLDKDLVVLREKSILGVFSNE